MKKQFLNGAIAASVTFILMGCGGSSNNNSPADDQSNTLDIPETYVFTNESLESTVSYAGQTARHLLVEELTAYMENELPARAAENDDAAELSKLEFYYSLDAVTRDAADQPVDFSLSGGEQIIFGSGPTDFALSINSGEVSSGKQINNKLAGNDKVAHLLDGADGFFGWEGLNDNTPNGLVGEFFALLSLETKVTDGVVDTTNGLLPLASNNPTVTADGLNLRQLIQKFLLSALTFSQGTADYLSIDYGSDANLTLAPGQTYTEGAHDFDEAFGYFGASRDYNDIGDALIKSDKYVDTDGDNLVDIRSDYNFGNAQNCAKRDLGSTTGTDYTKTIFDAFLKGRAILQEAAAGATETSPGTLTAERSDELDAQIVIIAQTWEKCIAATVVHYINDITKDDGDIAAFEAGKFADLEAFENLAKHWAEMKGFALGLQFSPFSPFRTGTVDGETVALSIQDLENALFLMGQAPVLADGTMNGVAYSGGVEGYESDLLDARDILEVAYGFDSADVIGW